MNDHTVEVWRIIMQLKDRPASLVLSRQMLSTPDRCKYASASGVARGTYVLTSLACPEINARGVSNGFAFCYETATSTSGDHYV